MITFGKSQPVETLCINLTHDINFLHLDNTDGVNDW